MLLSIARAYLKSIVGSKVHFGAFLQSGEKSFIYYYYYYYYYYYDYYYYTDDGWIDVPQNYLFDIPRYQPYHENFPILQFPHMTE